MRSVRRKKQNMLYLNSDSSNQYYIKELTQVENILSELNYSRFNLCLLYLKLFLCFIFHCSNIKYLDLDIKYLRKKMVRKSSPNLSLFDICQLMLHYSRHHTDSSIPHLLRTIMVRISSPDFVSAPLPMNYEPTLIVFVIPEELPSEQYFIKMAEHVEEIITTYQSNSSLQKYEYMVYKHNDSKLDVKQRLLKIVAKHNERSSYISPQFFIFGHGNKAEETVGNKDNMLKLNILLEGIDEVCSTLTCSKYIKPRVTNTFCYGHVHVNSQYKSIDVDAVTDHGMEMGVYWSPKYYDPISKSNVFLPYNITLMAYLLLLGKTF